MLARASLFRRLTDTNVYRTGSVKMWKTRRKISVDILVFLQCNYRGDCRSRSEHAIYISFLRKTRILMYLTYLLHFIFGLNVCLHECSLEFLQGGSKMYHAKIPGYTREGIRSKCTRLFCHDIYRKPGYPLHQNFLIRFVKKPTGHSGDD